MNGKLNSHRCRIFIVQRDSAWGLLHNSPSTNTFDFITTTENIGNLGQRQCKHFGQVRFVSGVMSGYQSDVSTAFYVHIFLSVTFLFFISFSTDNRLISNNGPLACKIFDCQKTLKRNNWIVMESSFYRVLNDSMTNIGYSDFQNNIRHFSFFFFFLLN